MTKSNKSLVLAYESLRNLDDEKLIFKYISKNIECGPKHRNHT